MATCYAIAKDNCVARSISQIESYDYLTTEGTNVAQDTLLLWLIEHYRYAHLDVDDFAMHKTVGLSGFSSFYACYSDYKEASKIDYLPIIPESPTKAPVIKRK